MYSCHPSLRKEGWRPPSIHRSYQLRHSGQSEDQGRAASPTIPSRGAAYRGTGGWLRRERPVGGSEGWNAWASVGVRIQRRCLVQTRLSHFDRVGCRYVGPAKESVIWTGGQVIGRVLAAGCRCITSTAGHRDWIARGQIGGGWLGWLGQSGGQQYGRGNAGPEREGRA